MSTNGGQQRERQVRLATGPLAAGALGTVAGVMLSLLGAGAFAAGLTLLGATSLLYGLHRLGRLGADPPATERRGASQFGAQHSDRDTGR